ncbi:MAG: hypothetical protein IKF83_01765 [Clostridia bacterium]|nr:hypothetical protein [Clostridia bacterium]
MLIEGEHYIVKPYNEDYFMILFNAYLSNKEGAYPGVLLIEQCISAYLDLKDQEKDCWEITQMHSLLVEKDIKYVDLRKYSEATEKNGDPMKAIRLFIGLAN